MRMKGHSSRSGREDLREEQTFRREVVRKKGTIQAPFPVTRLFPPLCMVRARSEGKASRWRVKDATRKHLYPEHEAVPAGHPPPCISEGCGDGVV